jgi:hypothetical protein
MPIKPHPKFDEIKKVLQQFDKQGKPFAAACYRCVEPQFAEQAVSGLGSQTYGARWTPKDSFPTVYLCETAEAALQEYLARGRRMKLSDHKSLPMMMLSVKTGFSGLAAPSQACPGHKNIVIFPENLGPKEILSTPSLTPIL